MLSSGSMFLFEVVVEEVKSYTDCKKFYIRSKFADVFTLDLIDPNELANRFPKLKKLKKKKATTRNVPSPVKKDPLEGKVQSGQSILLESNIDVLISSMKRFPIELTLWDKNDSVNRLGSTHIPWSPVYIEYLDKIIIMQDPAPAFVSAGYNVYDEYTSKRIATIRLNIKLTYLKDKITSSFRSLSEDNQNTFIFTGFDSKATTILSTVKDNPSNLIQETGIIKTIYRGGKRKFKTTNRIISEATKKDTKTETPINVINEYEPAVEPSAAEPVLDINVQGKKCNLDLSIVSLVKSDIDLDLKKQMQVIKNKSCTSISQEQHNILNYIFGGSKERLNNQVYCVGYCTVENDFTKSPVTSSVSSKASGSEKNDEKKKSPATSPVSWKASGSEKNDDNKSGQDDDVIKYKQVECANKKHNEVPEPPDERILLDFNSVNQECCNFITQSVQKVSGAMEAKLKFKKDDCYCSCECSFGFVKKTKYCEICGGYEKAGEDFTSKPPNVPFPCPIFHNLGDKNKLKSFSSGSVGKKKDDSLRNTRTSTKSISKTVKEDRFKFNYGYTAPKIGHSLCATPCTGTLGAVPRGMGWLWTAGDVPGIKAGWRPGAISKRLLRKLNRAKIRQTTTELSGPTKKAKKQVEYKPTLIICKRNGEYIVEIQVDSADKTTVCNPLVYKIATADNLDKVKARARKERRLIRKTVGEVWSDPYHPEACQNTCYKAYKQAIGLDPYDPYNPECICPEEEYAEDLDSCSCSNSDVDSECSSLDVDWEIHFTPPSAYFR